MASASEDKAAELAAVVREIRERVRAQHPSGRAGSLNVPLPDLLPMVHARDAAQGKVAAIGGVNPRPGGFVNDVIQRGKRAIARSLNWFVRDQVEFNRASVAWMNAALDALNESNRVVAALAAEVDAARGEAHELRDYRSHWDTWRVESERRLAAAEITLLRSVAELKAAYEHRTLAMQASFERRADAVEASVRAAAAAEKDAVSGAIAAQHDAFRAELDGTAAAFEARFWKDVERVRSEMERVIHQELRVVRQRLSAAPSVAPVPVAVSPAASFDYAKLAERFRGSEEDIRERQRRYVAYFEGCQSVLDIGCGRGEFLELVLGARGIDLDPESVAYCRSRGLNAEVADLFTYLNGVPEASLDGIFSAQVIEHLEPAALPRMIELCARALRRGGVIVLETPNPECLAIFATHFYIDPTHTRPVPPSLAVFYLEEAGFGAIEVLRVAPAADSMPALNELPAGVRDAMFGALDYAVVARRL